MNQELSLEIRNALNKAKFGWSKWGGPNFGLVQKNLTEEWHCQACGDKETNELPPYMFEVVEREYIRICSKCHNIRIKFEIQPKEFSMLISYVRA